MTCELSPKTRDKCGAPIRDDGVGEAMIAENTVEEEPGETGGVERLIARDEVSVARESVADDPNRVVTVRQGKLDDVVHGDRAERAVGNFKRVQESERLVSWGLDPAALVARLDIRAHVPSNARPRVVALD